MLHVVSSLYKHNVSEQTVMTGDLLCNFCFCMSNYKSVSICTFALKFSI
jgi:hypothetical protein